MHFNQKNFYIILAILIISLMGNITYNTVKISKLENFLVKAYPEYIKSLSPEDIIKEYFETLPIKAIKKRGIFFTEAWIKDFQNPIEWPNWGLKEIKKDEGQTTRFKQEYYQNSYDVVLYSVRAYINPPNNWTIDADTYTWNFVLVKETKNSAWLIDEWGIW